jgi:hypothetical protein
MLKADTLTNTREAKPLIYFPSDATGQNGERFALLSNRENQKNSGRTVDAFPLFFYTLTVLR